MTTFEHRVVEPRVLYFGTPVVLISTENPDGTTNLAPMSSAWWVGRSCLLGLDETSATTINLRRTGEVVLNLADATMAKSVDRLALCTGTPEVPAHKAAKGYEYLADKFSHAGLTEVASDTVRPHRVAEAKIALEATVQDVRPFAGSGSGVVAVETRIERTHVVPELLIPGSDRHINPDAWDPLIMKFTHLYGLSTNLGSSRLAQGWQIPDDSGPSRDLAEAKWVEAYPGVDRSEFEPHASISRWRLRPEAALPDHEHEQPEYLLVRSGIWRSSDGQLLGPGGVLGTGRGQRHGGTALTSTELWAIEVTRGGPS